MEVPPLRERMEDLPQLAQAVREEIGELEGRRKPISPEVVGMLEGYEWPGNVRERRLILMTRRHMEGRNDRTAEALGVSLKTLYNRLHEYGWMGGTEATREA